MNRRLWTPRVRGMNAAADEGPKMRLLRCDTCRMVEELPDYTGPRDAEGNPLYDTLLEELVSRHRNPDGTEHIGRLFGPISRRHLRNPDTRASIMKQVWGAEYGMLEGEFQDSRNTFVEDAQRCFNRHDRPKGTCIDWHDHSRLLGRPMLRNKDVPPNARIYLCDFCPVSSHVTTEKRKAAGAYDA